MRTPTVTLLAAVRALAALAADASRRAAAAVAAIASPAACVMIAVTGGIVAFLPVGAVRGVAAVRDERAFAGNVECRVLGDIDGRHTAGGAVCVCAIHRKRNTFLYIDNRSPSARHVYRTLTSCAIPGGIGVDGQDFLVIERLFGRRRGGERGSRRHHCHADAS